MPRTSLGECTSNNTNLHKKQEKNAHRKQFRCCLCQQILRAHKFTHATCGTAGDICTSLVRCCTTCKEESGVTGINVFGG